MVEIKSQFENNFNYFCVISSHKFILLLIKQIINDMKKLIFIFAIYSIFSFKNDDTTVYLCDSPNAKKYHLSETCRGLNACKHLIIKTTQSKARNIGLALCGWE